MSRFLNSKNLKYVYIIVSVIMVLALFTNVTVLFVKAWFTDEGEEYDDAKVAHVDAAILINGAEVGGTVEITHNDNFTQADDVYTFTPATASFEYNTPAIGDSLNLNIQVQNKGWAPSLVRIIGFTIYYIENTHVEENKNNLVAFENQVTINNNSELWVSEFTDPAFDTGNPETNMISYNWYLNRLLCTYTDADRTQIGETVDSAVPTETSDPANVVVSLTNNSINPAEFPKLYIDFQVEMTVYESNAYQTNANNPPFGLLSTDFLNNKWTAWQ